VLNPDALALVRRAAACDPDRGADIPYHDWWLYLLLSGAGARIELDMRPGLLYRQHEANTFGLSRGGGARWRRILMVTGGAYGGWVRDNLRALSRVEDLLLPQNRLVFLRFKAALSRNRLHALSVLKRLGVRRETTSGTV